MRKGRAGTSGVGQKIAGCVGSGRLFGRCNEWLKETVLVPSDASETRLCHSHHQDTMDDESKDLFLDTALAPA